MLFQHLVLVLLAQLHDARHVNFVEGSKRRSGVLRLLQTLCDAQTHTAHLDAGLVPATGNAGDGSSLFLCGLVFGRRGGRFSALLELLLLRTLLDAGRILTTDFLGCRRRGRRRLLKLRIAGTVILGLFWCLLFRRRFVDGARLEAEEVLADGDRVFLTCEELGDATSRWSVYGNVNLNSSGAGTARDAS